LAVFSPVRRFLLVASFVAGLLALLLGLYLEFSETTWWKHYPYLQNLSASLTGFLIGVPVALVALSSFTGEREEKIILARVNRLTQTAWDEYRDAVIHYCRDDVLDALDNLATDVQETHDNIVQLLKEYNKCREPIPYDARLPTDAEYRQLLFATLSLPSRLEEQIQRVSDALPSETALQVDWSGLRGTWATLDAEVRLQRMERGLAWFDQHQYYELRNEMESAVHPLAPFADLHYPTRAFPDSNRTMRAMPGLFRQQISNGKGTADSLLWQSGSVQFHNAQGYARRAAAAHIFLTRLRETVQKIELSGWPQNATEPKREPEGVEGWWSGLVDLYRPQWRPKERR
jgi:hypothetical protein